MVSRGVSFSVVGIRVGDVVALGFGLKELFGGGHRRDLLESEFSALSEESVSE